MREFQNAVMCQIFEHRLVENDAVRFVYAEKGEHCKLRKAFAHFLVHRQFHFRGESLNLETIDHLELKGCDDFFKDIAIVMWNGAARDGWKPRLYEFLV